ncbi:MAG: hypothetical protein COW13_01775, partial [Candidatus Omnitrophica bacterium CG12_big_fil_rev_8_21_14_0_65_50_5]
EDLKDGEEPTELTPDHKKDHELIEEIKDAYLIQKVEQAIGGYKSAQDFYVSVLSETIQAIGETLVPDKNEVVTVLQRISDPQLRLKVWDLVDQNYKIGLGHEEPLNELKGLLNELTGGDLKSIQKDTDADILWDVIGLLDKRMYIRTDDLKSDEYENMPGSEKFIKTEINPMMGWRGVGMLLDLPELYKEWHLAAIKKAVDTKRFKAAVFFPIVRRPIEVYKAYRMMREMGMEGQVQIGIMTELVTNAVNADEFTVVGLVEDDERFNNLVENPEALVQQLKDQRLIRKNGLMTKRFKDIVLKDRLDDFVIEGYTEDKRKEILGYLKSLIIFVDFTSTGGNDLRQGFGDDRNGG